MASPTPVADKSTLLAVVQLLRKYNLKVKIYIIRGRTIINCKYCRVQKNCSKKKQI